MMRFLLLLLLWPAWTWGGLSAGMAGDRKAVEIARGAGSGMDPLALASDGNIAWVGTIYTLHRISLMGQGDKAAVRAAVRSFPLHAPPGHFIAPGALLPLPGGGVLLAGEILPEKRPVLAKPELTIMRIRADGSLDPAFGRSGQVVVPGHRLPGADTLPLAQAPDGSYGVLAEPGEGQATVLLRISSEGRLMGASLPLDRIAPRFQATALAADQHGWLIAGHAGSRGMLARLGWTGELDRAYGREGRLNFSREENAAAITTWEASSLLPRADGGVLVAGQVRRLPWRAGGDDTGEKPWLEAFDKVGQRLPPEKQMVIQEFNPGSPFLVAGTPPLLAVWEKVGLRAWELLEPEAGRAPKTGHLSLGAYPACAPSPARIGPDRLAIACTTSTVIDGRAHRILRLLFLDLR